jgi:hypothetical protein
MFEPSPQPRLEVHEIEKIDLRSIFIREDRTFTPWLSQPENLARLARALGIELELKAIEASSGTFRTDILASNMIDDTTVVIENQFGRSDHDHFGKVMTYLAAHDAKTVVWIAEDFADEHRAALNWLNDNTTVAFYGVVPRLMRIAGSPPGLQFEIEIKPNIFVKQHRGEERSIDSEIFDLRERFWPAFNQALQADDALSRCRLRFGGRLGFRWILPELSADWTADEPHVLVFIQAGKGRRGTGVGLECRKGARLDAEERLERAREALRARGVALGSTPADLSETRAIDAAVSELLGRVKPALEELSRAFAQPPAPLAS